MFYGLYLNIVISRPSIFVKAVCSNDNKTETLSHNKRIICFKILRTQKLHATQRRKGRGKNEEKKSSQQPLLAGLAMNRDTVILSCAKTHKDTMITTIIQSKSDHLQSHLCHTVLKAAWLAFGYQMRCT